MKKRVLIVLGILIAAGGIGTGVWYHFGSGQAVLMIQWFMYPR